MDWGKCPYVSEYLIGYAKWNRSKTHQESLCRMGKNPKQENINEVWNLLSTFLAIWLFSNGFWSSQMLIKIVTFWSWNLKRSYLRYNGCFRSGELCTCKKDVLHSVFYFNFLTLWAEIKGKHDHLNRLKYCNLLQASPGYHNLHLYCYLHLNAITR